MSAGAVHTAVGLVPCKAIKLEGVYFSDGSTSAWEAEVECNQGDGVFAITYGRNAEEAEANARLIAAAPELVEVCQRILDRGYISSSIEEERGDFLALEAALTKAGAA